MRTGWCYGLLFAIAFAGPAHGQDGPAKTLDAGPLRLEICVSGRTATLFHVVDQVSGWSEFCHGQYAEDSQSRDGGFSPRDRELLARHVTVRTAHGWGRGLEQTFYTPADLDAAIKTGVAAGSLTAAEAAIEREVLLHFAPRIDALRERQAAVVRAFAERLVAQRANLQEFAQKVSRFCGGTTVTVPVFLLANPSEYNCGGGFNGGRLTWEVPSQSDTYYGFLHEVFHAFLEPHRAQFDEVARRVPGLDSMTLNEGMAYALSPGLLHPEGSGDPLLSEVRRDIERKSPLTNNYTRFHRLGLALRPLLREALDDKQQTLTTFLPRAADAWRVAVALDLTYGATADGDKLPEGTWFSAGPAWRELTQLAASRGHGLSSFNHSAEHYRKILSRSRPGSMVVLLFALDHRDKNVPEAYQDMLPIPWSQIGAALERGETLEMTGKARERRIVLLAAPTQPQLVALIQKTRLLSPDAAAAPPKQGKGQPITEIPIPSCDRIDYSHPDPYATLIPHLGNKEHILKIAATIGGKTPEEKLVAIGRWVHSHLVYKADAPYEWRDFDRLLGDGNYGGCADYSVVFGSLARGCGIPTVWVKTLDCDWIREFRRHGTEGTWSGHVFLEVFLHNRWVLLDDTSLVLYEDYDPKDAHSAWQPLRLCQGRRSLRPHPLQPLGVVESGDAGVLSQFRSLEAAGRAGTAAGPSRLDQVSGGVCLLFAGSGTLRSHARQHPLSEANPPSYRPAALARRLPGAVYQVGEAGRYDRPVAPGQPARPRAGRVPRPLAEVMAGAGSRGRSQRSGEIRGGKPPDARGSSAGQKCDGLDQADPEDAVVAYRQTDDHRAASGPILMLST